MKCLGCIAKDAQIKYLQDSIAEFARRNEPKLDTAIKQIDEVCEQWKKVRYIFKWLLGEEGDFPARREGDGVYYWRTELRKKIEAL